jgi:hypothetical protein
LYLIVMEQRFEPRVLEVRAFVLMFLFGFASISILYLQRILFVLLLSSSRQLQLLVYMMQVYMYLLSPVLLFVAFYELCGRNIPERIASTLISVILGGLVGIVVGGFFMSGVAVLTFNWSYGQALTIILSELEYVLISDVLFALAAVALTFVVKRWDETLTLPGQEWKFEKPVEISLASGIYVACGVLTLCVLPILFLFPFSSELDYLVLEVGTFVLVVIAGGSQLIIGRAIYRGRRWAWAVALIGSIVSLAINVEVLTIFAFSQVNWETVPIAEVASAVISTLLDVTVLGLIFTRKSRVYCKMVDVHT